MAGLIDLHNHALFGVDDGADSMDVCIRMLEIAYAQGIRAICFTPHYNPSDYFANTADIYAAYEKICAVSSRKFPDLALLLGNEIYAYPGSIADTSEGKCRTLGNSRTVLVEFSPHVGYREMRNRFLDFITAGYSPVLAHAERYACLLKHPERVKELVDMRVLIQVNAEAVVHLAPFYVHRFVHGLLAKHLVHVVASDMHTERDVGDFARAHRKVLRKYGKEYAKQLFYSNPKRILLQNREKE